MLLDVVDAAVEAYEAAREAHPGEAVDLREFAPSPADSAFSTILVELIRVDMEHRWGESFAPRLDDYLQQFPELLERRECLTQIAFEEYRLRVQAGEHVDRGDYDQRFRIDTSNWPEFASEPSSVFATQHPNFSELSACDPDFAQSLTSVDGRFPTVGHTLWGFRLIEELGRGAFGRVYLARQAGLADRLVALKITTGVSHEPLKLAQLQHTNIVPIYSQHGDEQLQGFCMPFLGRTTLANRIAERRTPDPNLASSMVATRSIREVPTVSNDTRESAQAVTLDSNRIRPISERTCDPIREVVTIAHGLCLGLQHAHERDIIHCDLKPANILLTDQGVPLILDFHIARSRSSGPAAIIGGTLPYMSPEQLFGFGTGNEVGPRSDIYSLGVVLYELLAGRLPFPIHHGSSAACLSHAIVDRQSPPPSLCEIDHRITPGLASIIGKCLEFDPARRYATAGQVAEDLDRYLRSLPLRYALDPSWRERCAKWRRRHPRLTSSSTVGILALVILFGVAVAWQRREHRIATIAANAKFHEMEQELPILWGLAETETLDAPRSNEFINRTAKIFADYRLESLSSWKDMPDIARLPAEHQVHLVEHLCLLTFVRFEMALSEATQTSGDDRHRLLAQARLDLDRLRCLGLDASNSPAIRREASRLATLEGDSMVTDPEIPAQDLAANAALLEKRLSALQLMRARRFTEALPLLQELATQRPDDIALMLQLGNCYRALRRWSSAEACYLACGALRPDLTFPFYFQGLLHLEQRQYAASVHAFSKSLALEEDVGARINLALAYRGLGNHQKAIDNLSRAIELGTSETRVWLLLSQSYEQLGKPEAAMRAREMWSTSKPADVLSWIAFGVDQLPTDASAAESAFREALKLDPSSLAALQNLAHVLAERKNQPQEALDVLTTALAQSPHDPLLLGSRAVLAARIGDQKCARRDADQALAVAPTSAMARYQAACVLTLLAPEDSASRAQALDLLEKTVALEPNLGTLFVADTDLRPLRSEKRFVDIVALANRLNQTRPISPQDDREQGE